MHFSYREVKAIAACKNFTRAAEELNESQPCLSRHILELEERIGAPLFYRNPVSLTPAGIHYLEGIGKILEATDELYGECRQLMRLKVKDFSIAAFLYGGKLENAVFLTCSHMVGRFPRFTFTFEDSRNTTVEQSVADGTADIGIVMYDPTDTLPAGMEAVKLFDQPCVPLVHKDSPVANRPVKISELEGLVVLESPNRKLRVLSDMILNLFRRHGVELRTRMKNFETVAQAAIGLRTDEILVFNIDAGLVAGGQIRVFDPNITAVDLVDVPDLSWPLYLIYRTDNDNDATALFIEHLQEEIAAL